MKYCSNCGAQSAADAKYCARCGKESFGETLGSQPIFKMSMPTRAELNAEGNNQNFAWIGCSGLIASFCVLGFLVCLFAKAMPEAFGYLGAAGTFGSVAWMIGWKKTRRIGALIFIPSFLICVYGASKIPPSKDATEQNNSSADAASSAPQIAKATAKPDRHAEREVVRTWWNQSIMQLALSDECLVLAGQTENDATSASYALSEGQKYATMALQTIGNEHPNGWDEISDQLGVAASNLNDGLASMTSYLDSQKPSEAASALRSASSVRDDIDDATHAARLRFMSMGGKWSDLDDLESTRANVDKMLHVLQGR